MGFESVRGYVHLASGLTEATKARATEAAQSLLSLPAAGISTGSKVAVQAGALAEEMLSVATTNHSSLTELVRSEVDVAVTRLGLVSAEKLEEAQAEATRLRTEVARLRAASMPSTTNQTKKTTKRAAAPRPTVRSASAMNGSTKPTSISRSAKTATTATTPKKVSTTRSAKTVTSASKPASGRRSAVSTKVKPAGP